MLNDYELGNWEAEVEDLKEQLEHAEAEYSRAEHEWWEQSNDFDAIISSIREEAERAAEGQRTFLARVVQDGLRGLSVDEVHHLFGIIGVSVSIQTLRDQNISGEVLHIGLAETEMEEGLGIRTLGDRRRLCVQLQRLRAGQGLFDASSQESAASAWTVREVGDWLDEVGLSACKSSFRKQRVDGLCLVHLDGSNDNLELLGAGTAGIRTILRAKLGSIARDTRRVSDVPDEYVCPISQHPMEDPVLAEDGVTYERKEIERWLMEHRTSPVTRAVLKGQLFSNRALRSAIEKWRHSNGTG